MILNSFDISWLENVGNWRITIYFFSIGQKDAQGSVSSLRVRIKRVWALRTRFAMVFGGFLFYGQNYGLFEHRPERCARAGFPPSGSYEASFGSAHSFCIGFWLFFDLGDRTRN